MKITILGVAGGSCSGKTTFAAGIQKYLGAETCAILAQDHYYIDQSSRFTGDGESVNFDHPDAIDFTLIAHHLRELRAGRTIQVPIYDFATHKRLPNSHPLKPHPVIIVDGFQILSQAPIRAQLDYGVFISASEEVRFSRRLKRDTRERGRLAEGVRKQFLNQVKPMHDLYVEPSRQFANQIISGETDFTQMIQEVAQHVTSH